MGRLIPLAAYSRNGQAYAKPRVVYVNEEFIKVVPGSKTTSKTKVIEALPGGELNTYVVYEKAIEIEAQRNPSTTDLIIKQQVAAGLAGAGTTQGAGTVLTKFFNEATTIGAAATEAFVMPAATAGRTVCFINNDVVADAAKIFPASGGTINGAAADAVYSQPGQQRRHFVCIVAGAWVVADDYGKN
jgi:hypothetical protein